MNSGLIEARDLADRIGRIERGREPSSLLDEAATRMHDRWKRLLAGEVRARPGADGWVQQRAARILACLPASGDDLDSLLGQIGLTTTSSGRDAALGA